MRQIMDPPTAAHRNMPLTLISSNLCPIRESSPKRPERVGLIINHGPTLTASATSLTLSPTPLLRSLTLSLTVILTVSLTSLTPFFTLFPVFTARPVSSHRFKESEKVRQHTVVQEGLRRGGLTPACGFAHTRIGEERYDIIIGKAEAAQKRLFCQGVYFKSKERSFVQLAIKIDGNYCCCMKNTAGGRCTM